MTDTGTAEQTRCLLTLKSTCQPSTVERLHLHNLHNAYNITALRASMQNLHQFIHAVELVTVVVL